MTAYGAILASGPRKVVVIVPPCNGQRGVAFDLATGELVPIASDEGKTWHVLTGFTMSGSNPFAVAPGDSIHWSTK